MKRPAGRARRWIPAASAGGTLILQAAILTVIPAPDRLLASLALALAWITALTVVIRTAARRSARPRRPAPAVPAPPPGGAGRPAAPDTGSLPNSPRAGTEPGPFDWPPD